MYHKYEIVKHYKSDKVKMGKTAGGKLVTDRSGFDLPYTNTTGPDNNHIVMLLLIIIHNHLNNT